MKCLFQSGGLQFLGDSARARWERSLAPTGAEVRNHDSIEVLNSSAEALWRYGFDLPTEAQWEYAARAGTATVWFTGNGMSSLEGYLNVADRFCRDHMPGSTWSVDLELDDGYVCHALVVEYRPNAFGLHNLSGNVWEWCRDSFGGYESQRHPGDGLHGLRSPTHPAWRYVGSPRGRRSLGRQNRRRARAPQHGLRSETDPASRLAGCVPRSRQAT